MGQIRKRGEVYWIRYYRNGKRLEESTRSSDRDVARRLLKMREGDVAKGVPVSPANSRVTFDNAAEDLEREYKQNGRRSIDALERRFKLHLTPYFGGRRLASLTTADVRAYVERRQAAGAANATINRELAALKRLFNLAKRARRILADNVPHIEMLQEDNIRTGFFERDQFEAMRAALPAELRAVVTFAYLTGWRKNEILSLDWRQVDFAAGTVTLDPGTTKNRDGRVFPFAALPELKALLEAQRDETSALEREKAVIIAPVFHRSGARIVSIDGAWRTACTAAGCPGRILHDFRRTAVRNLVRAGVPERVAMLLSGHKTRSVFERYNVVSEADLSTGVARLAESMGTFSGTITPSAQIRAIR
jgi:integrase